MHYVYVIQNEQKEFYLGYTSDLKKRVSDHNKGYNKSTKGKSWQLVYYEAYVSREASWKREYRLKHGGRSKQLLYKRIQESLE